VYSNSIISEDYDISSSLFNKKFNNDKFKNFSSKRVTEVYNSKGVDKSDLQQNLLLMLPLKNRVILIDKVQFEISYKDIAAAILEERVSKETLKKINKKGIRRIWRITKFELEFTAMVLPQT
jgi:two-component system phosphate regulon sensor histidine kinase PhoR